MAEYGQLGHPLGSIVLGYGSKTSNITTTQGVVPGDVGPIYDVALGFDPGTGAATMVGYCVAEGKDWSETTQLQQMQQLITVASPNLIDRDLTFWPKVSQGDWSGGEREVTYGVNNVVTRYYTSDGGVDTSVPAALTMMPSLTATLTNADTGTGCSPLASDGSSYYLGVTGQNLIIGNEAGTTTYQVPAASTHEIYDILTTPYGVFVGSIDGIFNVTPAGVVTQWTNDPITALPGRSLAYFNNTLFYITTAESAVNSVALAGGATAGVAFKTLGGPGKVFEPHFSCIASTAAGLFMSAWREASAANAAAISVLYTSDGSANPLTRVGDIYGQVVYAHEMNGTLYILVYGPQVSDGAFDYTLYTFANNQLTVLDDLRFANADFRASAPAVATTAKAQLSGDGRFLYIAWPGLQTLRYDTVLLSYQKVGNPGAYGSSKTTAHRVVTSQSLGLIDGFTANGVSTFYRYDSNPAAAGTSTKLTTSYYDFATPGLSKFLRTFEVRFATPLPAGASVMVAYQTDSGSEWMPLTIQATSLDVQTCFFPYGTSANRVRFQLTLTASSGGVPVIQSTAIRGNLGRIWKATLTCKREQMVRNGQVDPQGLKGKDLIANLYNAYRNAGNCTVYVPSPSTATGVETVVAVLEEYNWVSTKGSPDPGDQGSLDLEGNVDITLVEN